MRICVPANAPLGTGYRARYYDPSSFLTPNKNVIFDIVPSRRITQILPNSASRVLISARHGGGYPTSYQQGDGRIRITATVEGVERGDRVFFEAVDPDDASPYGEDTDPNTVWNYNPATMTISGIEGLAANADPNDNRDPNKNGRVDYETFQNNCFGGAIGRSVRLGDVDGRSVQINDTTWEVSTTLLITDRFAGDNYVVRATAQTPSPGSYFDQQPNVGFRGTAPLTAWKRIYVETDRMYRAGTLLDQDAASGQNKVVVQSAGNLRVNDRVRVFDSAGRQANLLTITAITVSNSNTTDPARQLSSHAKERRYFVPT